MARHAILRVIGIGKADISYPKIVVRALFYAKKTGLALPTSEKQMARITDTSALYSCPPEPATLATVNDEVTRRMARSSEVLQTDSRKMANELRRLDELVEAKRQEREDVIAAWLPPNEVITRIDEYIAARAKNYSNRAEHLVDNAGYRGGDRPLWNDVLCNSFAGRYGNAIDLDALYYFFGDLIREKLANVAQQRKSPLPVIPRADRDARLAVLNVELGELELQREQLAKSIAESLGIVRKVLAEAESKKPAKPGRRWDSPPVKIDVMPETGQRITENPPAETLSPLAVRGGVDTRLRDLDRQAGRKGEDVGDA